VTLYLTLNQVLHIAEEVTGVSLETLARVSQLHLLASKQFSLDLLVAKFLKKLLRSGLRKHFASEIS
jgi:hypothetical protein